MNEIQKTENAEIRTMVDSQAPMQKTQRTQEMEQAGMKKVRTEQKFQ